jgi:hypothetical protein
MTRRKMKQQQLRAELFRSGRIKKLLQRGWISHPADIPEDAIPVDPDLINIGNSYHHPTWFEDRDFHCQDCGALRTWKAEQQRQFYESTFAFIFVHVVRCPDCSRRERERISEARKRAGHDPV